MLLAPHHNFSKMTVKKIREKIITDLSEKSNEKRILFNQTMAPTTMEIKGVTNPLMKEIIRKWLPEIKTLSDKEWIDLAKQLVDTRIFECNQLAFELLWKNKNALALITGEDIECLGKNIDNWATVDTLAVMVSGWAWRENQISDEVLLGWLHSENRWWRRLALVSTIPLNLKSRGGKGDPRRTLMLCEKVVSDRDELIVKALSWALRELSKSNRETVIEFMQKHEKELPNLVKKEVSSKLITGKKNG